MIDFKTYKTKLYALISGIVILSIFSYNLAIKKTIRLSRQKKQLIEKLQFAEGAPEKIMALTQRTNDLNRLLGTNISEQTNCHVKILEISSDYSKRNPVVIIDYPKEHKFQENDYLLNTNILTMEGRFIDLLKYLHKMESQNETGKIVSSNFYLEKKRFTKKNSLMLTLYIQNITSNNNEE